MACCERPLCALEGRRTANGRKANVKENKINLFQSCFYAAAAAASIIHFVRLLCHKSNADENSSTLHTNTQSHTSSLASRASVIDGERSENFLWLTR